ncbi:MAG: PhoU domain-containing protein, partial [Oscillospiraceae bacterium]
KYKEELDALNPVFFDTPALALQSCHHLLLTSFTASRKNIDRSLRLLSDFDEELYQEIMEEESQIDRLTDRVNSYIVELLPHLQLEDHVAILNQYYKVTTEFERLGDHAVRIADTAASMKKANTVFSQTAMAELSVLEDAVADVLDDTEQTFRKRDLGAANRIEPKVQIIGEIVSQLKRNHLQRMSTGQCNVYADVSFSNLMVEFRRIAGVCSNVGVATVVRVHPELADHEHLYFESLHAGGDAAFNAVYQKAYEQYFDRLAGRPAVV